MWTLGNQQERRHWEGGGQGDGGAHQNLFLAPFGCFLSDCPMLQDKRVEWEKQGVQRAFLEGFGPPHVFAGHPCGMSRRTADLSIALGVL